MDEFIERVKKSFPQGQLRNNDIYSDYMVNLLIINDMLSIMLLSVTEPKQYHSTTSIFYNKHRSAISELQSGRTFCSLYDFILLINAEGIFIYFNASTLPVRFRMLSRYNKEHFLNISECVHTKRNNFNSGTNEINPTAIFCYVTTRT